MFWVLIILSLLLTRIGISSMLSYNRVKKETASFPVLSGLEFPASIRNINNPILRWLRKFIWQASTDGTKQQADFAILLFYFGIGLGVMAVIWYPENAEPFFG